MAIPAFLSYSHRDKVLAGLVKAMLDYYSIDAFLAHEDLQPSEEWQLTILSRLKDCVVFLPLLTNSFAESDWTDQETGVAVALGKIVVPMKVHLNPYGFVGKYQAQSFAGATSEGRSTSVIAEGCWNIVRKLASHKKTANAVKGGVISAFGQSRSFSEASRNAERLRSLEPYSEAELDEILTQSCQNDQIYNGFDARAYVNDLIVRDGGRIDKRLARKFAQLQA